MRTVIELFNFFLLKRKLWMFPLVFILVVMGGLLLLAKGSVFAPFIYTLF